MAYQSLPVGNIHVATGVAARTGALAGLLDNLRSVELERLLAAGLFVGCAGVHDILLAKVGSVVAHVLVVQGSSSLLQLG